MDCPTCEAKVDAYVDGELSASESADFELSLEACPNCRRRFDCLLRKTSAAWVSKSLTNSTANRWRRSFTPSVTR